MSFSVVTLRDGGCAMRDDASGEVMHPHGGPRFEAERLYVGPSRLVARLAEAGDDPLVVLDVGLGAGSNAVAAWRASAALPTEARRLTLVSFDRTVGALAVALDDPRADAFDLTGAVADAARALLGAGERATARTHWRLVLGDLPDTLASLPPASVDVVFWDPYSPRADPSLWGVAAFAALRRVCRARATVHTYSGATSTRAALLLAGFVVGLGAATREDRTSTLAATDLADVERPLDRRWLERLRRSSAPLPTDAPPDGLERIAALPQLAL